MGTQTLHKMCDAIVFLFHVEMSCMKENETIEYLWHCATKFRHSFTMCL